MLALAALAVLALASRSAPAAATNPQRDNGMNYIPAVRTGGTDAVAWTRTRWSAARDFLAAQGYDAARAASMAAAVVAQWARETGWGRSEWGYNVGNVKGYQGWPGTVQRLPDGLTYRAHATLRDGVASVIGLLEGTRYRAAWDQLARDGDAVLWYRGIIAAGYHPMTPEALSEYASVRARVREKVGA
ncbi:MAG: hypothetical protein WCK28_23870 [Burkholderiales bacterium]